MNAISILILAASHDAGWNSALPNAAHLLAGRSLLDHVLAATAPLAPQATVVATSSQSFPFPLAGTPGGIQLVETSAETDLIETLQLTRPYWQSQAGCVLVLPGDIPLITAQTLQRLVAGHRQSQATLTLLSTIAALPSGRSRVIRDGRGELASLVADNEASTAQRQIKEVDSGVYCLQIPFLIELLGQSEKTIFRKGESLTELVQNWTGQKALLKVVECDDPCEVARLTNRQGLSQAEKMLRERKVQELMRDGVTMLDPETTYIDSDVIIGRDSVIYPNVFIEGKSVIGSGCRIYPHVRISRSVVEDRVTIFDSSVIEDSLVHVEAQIGPFARLRPKAEIGEAAHVGNFVEVKNTRIGKRSKANHHSYLGDAEIGEGVNIGAGTITCNYDGVKKNKTVIEDRVFIGSDTQLVAPVTVHAGAYVAAGSSICEDVPAEALAIARSRQVNKEGWVKKQKEKA